MSHRGTEPSCLTSAQYTEAQIRSSVYGAIYGNDVASYTAPYTEHKKISVYKISVYGAVYGDDDDPYTAQYTEH